MNENNVSTNRKVDDAGIRLAPKPIGRANEKRMPAVRQEFVITPRLEYESTAEQAGRDAASTASDYQPAAPDAGGDGDKGEE